MVQRRKLDHEEEKFLNDFMLKEEYVNNLTDLSYDTLHFLEKVCGVKLDEDQTFLFKNYLEQKVEQYIRNQE